ncbi:flagellar protein FlgN [Rhizobiales bacterium L72]|uniref:Flagellar protein FlgN n=1 Tax=Propylenella binzhouense TaxID=2555902 RepID=A0A964WSG7_9HYPH|nr:flagellar protein FlgN [Propylenella binzhouense]
MNAVSRLEAVVDEETEALRARRGRIDLDDFNRRKSLGLLELSRAMRGVERAGHAEIVTRRLGSLRARLDANQAVLRVHMKAAQEISGLLAEAIRESESDGTYSGQVGARG